MSCVPRVRQILANSHHIEQTKARHLHIYLLVTKQAINSDLVREMEQGHTPIYFVSNIL